MFFLLFCKIVLDCLESSEFKQRSSFKKQQNLFVKVKTRHEMFSISFKIH